MVIEGPFSSTILVAHATVSVEGICEEGRGADVIQQRFNRRDSCLEGQRTKEADGAKCEVRASEVQRPNRTSFGGLQARVLATEIGDRPAVGVSVLQSLSRGPEVDCSRVASWILVSEMK